MVLAVTFSVPSAPGRHASHGWSQAAGLVPHFRLGCASKHRRWMHTSQPPAGLAPVRAASVEQEGPASAAAGEAPTEWVEVGVIGAPHGVRGEMKVQPLTDFPEERLGTPGTRWLRAPVPKIGRRRAPPPTEVELEYGRTTISKGNEAWIVKLEGVDTPEDARLLRGHAILIPGDKRESLEDEDEFYVQDLVGLRVFLQSSGEELGKVVDLFDGTGTYDVLRIRLHSSQQQQAATASPDQNGQGDAVTARAAAAAPPRFVLLPFVKEQVPVVDLAAGRMVITPPEGLLDLASSPAPKQERRESRGRRERRRGSRGGGGGAGDMGAAAADGEAEASGSNEE